MFGLVLVAGVASLFLFDVTKTPVPPAWNAAAEEQELFWGNRIEAIGSKSAYTEFSTYARAVENAHQGFGHLLAHRFGAALYANEGIGGMAVCDTSFSFGCLHELFKLAVAEYGEAPLEDMAEACRDAIGIWHPCQHAIGHGILANEGYDEASLRKALLVCEERYNDDPMNGCFGGVFMEYNLYSSVAIRQDPRAVIGGDWYAPCDSLQDIFQASCYYWLPQWWYERLHADGARYVAVDTFVTLGNLCRNVANSEFNRQCFQRVGQLSIFGGGHIPEKTIQVCKTLSHDSREELLCRAYAAHVLSNSESSGMEQGLLMCADLEGEQKAFCDAYARLEVYTPHDLPLPPEL